MRVSPLRVVSTTLPSSPPETMRLPSAAVARIAPSWTVTRRGSPSGATNNIASSPSTNTAVRLRKCVATMAPPAATGRVRSTTEAISPRVSVILRQSWPASGYSGHARLKTLTDCLFREIAADEHNAAETFLIFLPGPLMIPVQDHVHALKHEPLIVIFE